MRLKWVAVSVALAAVLFYSFGAAAQSSSKRDLEAIRFLAWGDVLDKDFVWAGSLRAIFRPFGAVVADGGNWRAIVGSSGLIESIDVQQCRLVIQQFTRDSGDYVGGYQYYRSEIALPLARRIEIKQTYDADFEEWDDDDLGRLIVVLHGSDRMTKVINGETKGPPAQINDSEWTLPPLMRIPLKVQPGGDLYNKVVLSPFFPKGTSFDEAKARIEAAWDHIQRGKCQHSF